jgi:hypothetical protein
MQDEREEGYALFLLIFFALNQLFFSLSFLSKKGNYFYILSILAIIAYPFFSPFVSLKSTRIKLMHTHTHTQRIYFERRKNEMYLEELLPKDAIGILNEDIKIR